MEKLKKPDREEFDFIKYDVICEMIEIINAIIEQSGFESKGSITVSDNSTTSFISSDSLKSGDIQSGTNIDHSNNKLVTDTTGEVGEE